MVLLDAYPMLEYLATDDENESDDPCLPITKYSWTNCTSDVTPRITALNLGFSGAMSNADLPDFSVMDALEIIDLSDNFLGHEFPDFLADFPKLKVLNLANNYLTGTVPTSLRKKSNEKKLKLTLTGESMTELCYSDQDVCPTAAGRKPSPGTDEETETSSGTDEETSPMRSGKKKTTPIVLGILIPIFLIFWAVVGFLAIRHQKRKAAAMAGQIYGNSGPAIPMYGNTMSPSPLLPGVNYKDFGIAAKNVIPDDQGVKNDQQMHQTV
ncbi:LRR receptor-like serine/threonine-protein kinase IOS1 isoform X2 [Papaver somniferum]|uniref:LRR receptor-like serine/threonine-protein kinase IOS1 isoform X2 n=1 Tax=Papaver somniferum TaxID=3469 RepID=UPI000E6FCCC4|nr:LRR receptor-like serine/threonine-protein kinase IOS1 isoform X2 [Papaver somniferum]